MTHSPVLIVGAGPIGQLAALLLSRHGIGSTLIDKHLSPATAPKAHAVNPRTLEICDSIGISASHIREIGASANDAGWVRFVGTLTGPEFGCLPYERQDDAALADTPFPLTNISQPKFEALLTAAIAVDDRVHFSRGVECVGIVENAEGVTATLADSAGSRTEISCDYLIAADGANSWIRNHIGIAMEGPEALQHYLMIHFEADLRRLTESRPGVLYFLLDPQVPGALIAYERTKDWVFMHPYDPAQQAPEMFDESNVRPFVEAAIGRSDIEIHIRNISPWAMSAQIAEHYRRGRIFLVGDAAHRFPPSGGLGLNTGAVDAQNLAWKLAAVLKGQAGDALLDTYEIERRPVAQINSDQSLKNAAKIFDLTLVLHGADPAKAQAHYEALSVDPLACPALPPAVEAQRPHFDSFNLQLGYRYASPAIIDPAPPVPASEISVEEYRASWEAGAHLPHRWVFRDGSEASLLSLVAPNAFTLIIGPRGYGFDSAAKSLGLNSLMVGRDFDDKESDWESLTGLPSDGALLIRPDGHIASRFLPNGADAEQQVNANLARLLAQS